MSQSGGELAMPIPIEPLQQVFMLFYAIFWGAIANVQPRWKPFQWHLFFAVPQARRRAIAAFGLLNVLPLIFFAYGMWALYGRGPTDTSLMAGSLHYFICGVAVNPTVSRALHEREGHHGARAAMPTNSAIDSDARKRCALPGARHRGR